MRKVCENMKTLRLVLSISFLFCSQIWAKDCNDFGAGISMSPSQKIEGGIEATDLTGDYNGDGAIDQVVFLHLIDRPVFSDDVKVVYLFDDKPIYPKKGSLAIGIILTGKEHEVCEKYIIYNDFFFELGKSGMWESRYHDYQVGLVKNGDQYWQKQIENLKYDALVIVDESAESFLLYWDGGTFVTQWDNSFDE